MFYYYLVEYETPEEKREKRRVRGVKTQVCLQYINL